ncbi:MAG: glycosyltransferase family 4 protein, partial [Thermosphaera sp.]
PMRVVVFSERLWPEGGGGELATYLILKLLASIGGFELEVYTGTEGYAKIPGASVRVVDLLRASNKVELFTKILVNKRLVEKAVERADVVYIPRFSYPVIPIAKKLGKKVVVHLHDYQPVSYTAVILSSEVERPMSDFKRTFMLEHTSKPLPIALASTLASPLTKLIRRWVGVADKIVCVSRRHEEILLKLAPEYEGKTIVIYNPLPELPSIKKNLSEKPVLLYSGGESYVKGFHVLLEALRLLGEKRQTNFKLILTNRYSQRSLKVVERLKIRYNLDIQVLGRIPYGELIGLHSQAWALLFPSLWEEPLPYAILESMIMGTIPISSRVGGVSELVKGTFAEKVLFFPGSYQRIADHVETLLSMDREMLHTFGNELRESALRRFSDEVVLKPLLRLLTENR